MPKKTKKRKKPRSPAQKRNDKRLSQGKKPIKQTKKRKTTTRKRRTTRRGDKTLAGKPAYKRKSKQNTNKDPFDNW